MNQFIFLSINCIIVISQTKSYNGGNYGGSILPGVGDGTDSAGGDAKLVIDAVKSRRQDDSNNRHLIADILLVLSSFPLWEMIHVRREENNVAQGLATFAVHKNVNRVWLNDPPECRHDPLQADFLAVHSMN